MSATEYSGQLERARRETGQVECPIDGCEYRGKPGSVEGHISGKTDRGHRGEVGENYREEIGGSVDENGGDGEDPSDLESFQEKAGEMVPEPEEAENPGRALVAATLVAVFLVIAAATLGSRSPSDLHGGQDQERQASGEQYPDPFVGGGR